ncbi:MAG: heat-inducible transcription repressor HrcA [Clostridia bacterium]|nr:heat-inducible transcription repressor HrcA [Clostridia bacterium]
MELLDRKYRILQAIIDDYILTALPVGSRTISRKYEQKLSSATIRNEMSDLEDLGYLDSPHTSAGRIPSNKAYRLYVDQMLQPFPLSVEDIAYIRSCFDTRSHQIEQISMRLARAISGMTNYTTAVMTRMPRDDQKLSHMQLVPVADRRVILILVTENGAVTQTPVDLDAAIDPDVLYTVSKFLSKRLEGVPMSKLHQSLIDIAAGEPEEMSKLLRTLAAQDDESPDVGSIVVGGRSNLLSYPEYSDVEKARNLLSVLETKDKMISLLNTHGEMEITVRIGPETGMEELKDCSVVTASYRMRDGRVNTIGLIGPTRMQYGKVLSVLNQVGRSLYELLDAQDDEQR